MAMVLTTDLRLSKTAKVVKEASDIILMDDNFSSIVKAIMWRRCVNECRPQFFYSSQYHRRYHHHRFCNIFFASKRHGHLRARGTYFATSTTGHICSFYDQLLGPWDPLVLC